MSDPKRPESQASPHSPADPARDPDVVIRLTPDGRVYFHDITAGMARMASELAPADRIMARRAELAEAAPSTDVGRISTGVKHA